MNFEEIDLTELPAAVNEAIAQEISRGATAQEAWVKDKG
jgi:hypothetical protein